MKKEKLNPQEIASMQIEIDNELNIIYDDPTYDGVINPEMYCQAPIKILWILKEVNDDGGYCQRKAFNKSIENLMKDRKDWYRTLDPIIYTTYSLLNGFMLWDEMDYIKDNPQMIDVLKQISYINIKKEAGGSVSFNDVLSKAYQKNRNIIINQIELSNPEVIICGNTLEFLMDDLKINKEELTAIDNIEYIIQGSRLIINAYHPNQRTITQEEYCDSIIKLVKKFYKV